MGASWGRTAPTNTGAGPYDRTATSFQASHPGADPSSQLQVLCRQPRREWEGQEEGEVWEERPLEGSRLPCSVRGCHAGEWERGESRPGSLPLISSGPGSSGPGFTPRPLQFPETLLTALHCQEGAGGGGAQRAGSHGWRVALDRCAHRAADITGSPQLQFLA